MKKLLTICRESGQILRGTVSSAYRPPFTIPVEGFPLSVFLLVILMAEPIPALSPTPHLNHYLGWKAIFYIVIYYLPPCNVNALVAILELHRIRLINKDNLSFPKNIFSSFNHSHPR